MLPMCFRAGTRSFSAQNVIDGEQRFDSGMDHTQVGFERSSATCTTSKLEPDAQIAQQPSKGILGAHDKLFAGNKAALEIRHHCLLVEDFLSRSPGLSTPLA